MKLIRPVNPCQASKTLITAKVMSKIITNKAALRIRNDGVLGSIKRQTNLHRTPIRHNRKTVLITPPTIFKIIPYFTITSQA
jgi:hypothetical protein